MNAQMVLTIGQEALMTLGLKDRVNLQDIKTRHRELVRQYHPDTGDDADPALIRKINAAYRIVTEYVTAYRFSFTEEEFYEPNPEERIRRQFMDDPLWGSH